MGGVRTAHVNLQPENKYQIRQIYQAPAIHCHAIRPIVAGQPAGALVQEAERPGAGQEFLVAVSNVYRESHLYTAIVEVAATRRRATATVQERGRRWCSGGGAAKGAVVGDSAATGRIYSEMLINSPEQVTALATLSNRTVRPVLVRSLEPSTHCPEI